VRAHTAPETLGRGTHRPRGRGRRRHGAAGRRVGPGGGGARVPPPDLLGDRGHVRRRDDPRRALRCLRAPQPAPLAGGSAGRRRRAPRAGAGRRRQGNGCVRFGFRRIWVVLVLVITDADALISRLVDALGLAWLRLAWIGAVQGGCERPLCVCSEGDQ